MEKLIILSMIFTCENTQKDLSKREKENSKFWKEKLVAKKALLVRSNLFEEKGLNFFICNLPFSEIW